MAAETDTTSRSPARRSAVIEWFLRRDALAAAARDPSALTDAQRPMYERARGAVAAADHVVPADGGKGVFYEIGDDVSCTLLALSLVRDAVAWALAADMDGPPRTLEDAWNAAPADTLVRAAGSDDTLARVRRLLIEEESLARSNRVPADLAADLAATRAFAKTLLERLERRANGVARLRAQRWARILGAVAAVIACILIVDQFNESRRPDLALHARWIASSSEMGWSATGSGMSGPRGGADVAFHTHEQVNPWVQFDLGHVTVVSRIVIENRIDCCQERAVPLILETSDDGREWREVARREESFSTWEKRFFLSRVRARFVRFRVPRMTMLHLRRVEIH